MATINGTNGDDDLRGLNDENDLIVGGAGDDSLRGFNGDDTLDGGAGADFFDAGRGDDRIEAVTEGDFAFFARRDGDDTIGRFTEGGVIELRDIAPEDVRIEAITANGVDGAFISTGRGLTIRIEDLGGASASDLVLTRIDNADDDTIITLSEPFDVPEPEPLPVNGLIGTEGDDVLIDQSRELNDRSARETFRGLGGDDVIAAFGGFATISGGDGNDAITADFIGNNIRAGDGDDRVTLDTIAPEGFDPSSVSEAGNSNVLDLGVGNDVALGGFFSDRISGGEGNDSINGRAGDDFVFGGAGNDRVRGGGGDDLVQGNDGNDTLFGNGGADTLDGGAGADRLFGGGGADTILEGSDSLRDVIDAGGGADTVALGNNRSADTVTLGAGADTIVLTPNEQSRAATDTVRDFQSGADQIDLSAFFGVSGGGATSPQSFDPSPFFFLTELDGGTGVIVAEQDPAPDNQNGPVPLDPSDVTFRQALFLEGVDASELGADDFFLGALAEAEFGGFVPEVATLEDLGLA